MTLQTVHIISAVLQIAKMCFTDENEVLTGAQSSNYALLCMCPFINSLMWY